MGQRLQNWGFVTLVFLQFLRFIKPGVSLFCHGSAQVTSLLFRDLPLEQTPAAGSFRTYLGSIANTIQLNTLPNKTIIRPYKDRRKEWSMQTETLSYLKEHANHLELDGPLLVTQKGKARFVVQNAEDYEYQQETLALLKLLILSDKSLEKETLSLDQAFGS